MALITCPECGNNVSDKADKCIHCGFPLETTTETEIKEENEEKPVKLNHGEEINISCYDGYLIKYSNGIVEIYKLGVLQTKKNVVNTNVFGIKKSINDDYIFDFTVDGTVPNRYYCANEVEFNKCKILEEEIRTIKDNFFNKNRVVSKEERNFSSKNKTSGSSNVGIVFAIIGIILFLSIISTTNNDDDKEPETETSGSEVQLLSEEEYKALCKEYSYKDVLRNPQDYVGQKIVITLEISSVHEKSWSNSTKYYFANAETEPGNGVFWGDRYGVFDKRQNTELKILKDDVIKIWGEISNPQETQSLILNSEEVFCIDMKYAELISE